MVSEGHGCVPSGLSTDDAGATYHVSWADGPSYTLDAASTPVQGDLRVLHADAHLMVVEKPAFLPSENTALIKDSVRSRLESLEGSPERIRLVHRLDWETSGLLVAALTAEAVSYTHLTLPTICSV